MKQFIKILALMMLVLCIMLCFVACGDDPKKDNDDDDDKGSNTDKPGTGGSGSGGGNKPAVLETIFTTNIKFNDSEVPYDGELHIWETYTGNTQPERTDKRFEYWKDGEKVADGGVGVSEPGDYEVRLYFTADGYKETYVSATFTIVDSYTITYAVGNGLELPEGMTVADILHKDSPTVFADNTKNLTLLDASLANYKFKGWYLDESCTQAISAIDGSKMGSKDVTLYALFQPYIPYPMPYEYTTGTTAAPSTIPAIPGYEKLTEGATPILDMQYVHEDSKEISHTQKYQTPDTESYYFTFNNYETTAGGQTVIQWMDFNDTFEGQWPLNSDTAPTWSANDGTYNGSMYFYKPFSTDHTKYDTVEFWLYCANSTATESNPDGDNIMLFMWTDGNDGKTLRYSISLNFSGWKKFTLRVSDFKAVNAGNLNISRIGFFAYDIHGEKATLSTNKTPNFIYLSNIYLTSYASSYKTTGAIPDGSSLRVLEALETLTVKNPTLSDAEITTLLGQVATTDTAIFNDILVNDQATLADCYSRILAMAEAWNAPKSSYYQDDALLNAIAVSLNRATTAAYTLVDAATPLDADITSCCLDAVKTALIIGDHYAPVHAQSWMVPVLYYFPSSLGVGEDALISSYIYTGAQLALQNNWSVISGIYQMTHLLAKREISVVENSADILSVMSIIRATYGTSMYPVTDDFINDMFAWFYECVDAFTYGGKLPEELEGSLVPYIRGMLLVYDIAPAETQAKFAALVKYYLAQDASLAAAITDAMYYDIEAKALTDIQASQVSATTPGNVSIFNSALGVALFKVEAPAAGKQPFYFLLSKDGTLVVNGITVDYTFAETTVFEGLATTNSLAFITDTKQIIVTADGVQLYDSLGYVTNESEELIIVGVNDTTKNTASISSLVFYRGSSPCIVLIEKSEDEYVITVNNYTGVDEVKIYIKGEVEKLRSEQNVADDFISDLEHTELIINFANISEDTYTFTVTVE